MKFFILQNTIGNWGDYSSILIHGMAGRDRKTGLLNLERTGPFVPPMSFPALGSFVVTDSLRKEMEAAQFPSVRFQPVRKKRIVELNWQDWNLQADNPAFYPKSGEPEDYLLKRKHSPTVASQMPELWEAVIQEGAQVKKVFDRRGFRVKEMYLLQDTWTGADIFRAADVLYIFVTTTGKVWFESRAAEYITFKEMPVKKK